MKKILLGAAVIVAMGISTAAKAQLVDEQNVTITMDLQPILQLKMNGPQNIDFVFDQISKYVGGITKYGVTSLSVSSTVSWDLYAVGYSSTGTNWDEQVDYGLATDANATRVLPCNLLEMRQSKANPLNAGFSGAFGDYSGSFAVSPSAAGINNVYTNAAPYTRPALSEKYIAGGFTSANYVAGGTYLVTNASGVGSGGNYYYTIDYRIVPGLPAIFPNAASNVPVSTALVAPNYAQPGVYTMNVKYVLMENN